MMKAEKTAFASVPAHGGPERRATRKGEMVADYIDKQATIGAIHSAIYSYFCGAEDGDALSEDEKLVLSVNKAICTAIKAFPSADVQPVRHGRWIDKDGGIATCSECGERWGVWSVMNHCPSCGARMDGE